MDFNTLRLKSGLSNEEIAVQYGISIGDIHFDPNEGGELSFLICRDIPLASFDTRTKECYCIEYDNIKAVQSKIQYASDDWSDKR
jgi:hypothetical protein